ncbi:unannotated protein [freshwater metagenome]|uniref:Unannotated protein n=1 Tax=freshwater metagenome TaxID=449393 RepID=A0A6J6EII9_9ZZZZ
MRRAIRAPKLRAGNHDTVEGRVGTSAYHGGSKTLGWVVCHDDKLGGGNLIFWLCVGKNSSQKGADKAERNEHPAKGKPRLA